VLFSVLTKKVSTSTLASVAVWLCCSMVISMLAMLIANYLVPFSIELQPGSEGFDPRESPEFQALMQERSVIQSSISKLSPTQLYSEVASSILGATRGGGGFSLGFRAPTMTQSVTASWPNVVAIAVGLVVCFAASYMSFIRSEVRPGG